MDVHSAEEVNRVASTSLLAGEFFCTSSDTCFINCSEDDRQCPGQQKLTSDCDVCSSPREKGAKMKQKYGHYKNAFYVDFRPV